MAQLGQAAIGVTGGLASTLRGQTVENDRNLGGRDHRACGVVIDIDLAGAAVSAEQ